jgi:hypothetical protein
MVETVLRIIFFGAGWVPFAGSCSIMGLILFTMLTTVIQLRKPFEKRRSKVFFIVMSWQFIFFLVTHTLVCLMMVGFNVWHPEAIAVWMYFLSVALVGLAVEIPVCLLSALIILSIRRGCSLFQLGYGFLLTIIMSVIIGWIAFNIANISIEKGWLRVRPVNPIVVS